MKGKYFFGILLILVGVALIVNRLTDASVFAVYWPLVIIAVGIYALTRRGGSKIVGIILTLIGLAIQVDNLGIIKDVDVMDTFWTVFWPIVLIIIGVWIIFFKSRHKELDGVDEDSIDYFAAFSGVETKNVSNNFKGGSVTGIFGGADIDLRESNIEKEAVLDLTAVFGGISIYVPETWKVIVTGVPIFGGWDNKAKMSQLDDDSPILKVNCLVMFGGVDIKHRK